MRDDCHGSIVRLGKNGCAANANDPIARLTPSQRRGESLHYVAVGSGLNDPGENHIAWCISWPGLLSKRSVDQFDAGTIYTRVATASMIKPHSGGDVLGQQHGTIHIHIV